ncbi:hypothetical protein FZEAL_7769 [Fusarium zealandicum]|uniref:Uncharacterized protein n=1 Tax=Fusarium zealandicum TaxID=1053134 RepID=A0A8H4UG22_9HYPO|nr:hypothetical protein FZEAL_7769 [Fusarium zealandicum]
MASPRPHWQRPRNGYNGLKSPNYGSVGSNWDQIHEPLDVDSCRFLSLRVRFGHRGPVKPLNIVFDPSWVESSEVINPTLYQDAETHIRGSLIRYVIAPGLPLSTSVIPGVISLMHRRYAPPPLSPVPVLKVEPPRVALGVKQR